MTRRWPQIEDAERTLSSDRGAAPRSAPLEQLVTHAERVTWLATWLAARGPDEAADAAPAEALHDARQELEALILDVLPALIHAQNPQTPTDGPPPTARPQEEDTDEVGVPFRSVAALEARLAAHLEAMEAARKRAERSWARLEQDVARHLGELREALLRTEETPDRLDAVLRERLADLALASPAPRSGEPEGASPAQPSPELNSGETLELLRQVFEPVFAVRSGLEVQSAQIDSLIKLTSQMATLASQVIQDLPWLVERVERALRKAEGETEDDGSVH